MEIQKKFNGIIGRKPENSKEFYENVILDLSTEKLRYNACYLENHYTRYYKRLTRKENETQQRNQTELRKLKG
jgi:hypothetical protein